MLPVLDLGFSNKSYSCLIKIGLICPSITNNIRKGGIRKPEGGGIVTLTKNEVFVGKGYDDEGLFILNVDQVINEKGSFSCAYLVDSIDVWHGRLGHVNLGYIKKMKECGIIVGKFRPRLI